MVRLKIEAEILVNNPDDWDYEAVHEWFEESMEPQLSNKVVEVIVENLGEVEDA